MSLTSVVSSISPKPVQKRGRVPSSPAAVAFRIQLGESLLALRQRMGWTRADLAALLPDVSTVDLQRWEAASALPKGVSLLRIIRLLGLDMSSIPAGAFHLASLLRAQRSVQPSGRGKKPVAVLDIAALLQAYRMQQGMTDKEFAAHVGVPITTYVNWELGVQPTGANVQLVADLLKLPVSAIRGI